MLQTFMDDACLLAKMFELVVPVLDIFQEEAATLGFEGNWHKKVDRA